MSNPISFLLANLHGGGVQRSTLNLLRGLAERGLEIELVLFSNDGVLRPRIPSAVSVVNLRSNRAVTSIFPLVNYLRQSRPAALVSSQAHVNVSAILATRLSRTKTRTLVTERNSFTAVASHAKTLVERLRPLLMRVFYPWADEVIAVSQDLAQEMEDFAGIPKQQIQVIYNPIVSENLEQQAAEKTSHPWLEDDSASLVLAVGRLSKQKDFATLLQAFAQLRSKQPAKLLILGEGPERKALEKMTTDLDLNEHVEMPGYLQNPYPYLAQAKVFVLSSAWEGLPSVIIEALALGTQVVSTNCPTGPLEILDHGQYGQLTPVGDPYAMSEAIAGAIDNPLPEDLMRTRAQAFSIENAVDAYYKLLQKPQ